MSPSTAQSGTQSKTWDTKEDKFIELEIDIVPLLRGATSKEDQRAWCGAMNRADQDFPDSYYEILLDE